MTGKRLAQVHPQRTKREYTLFCQALASLYPEAILHRRIPTISQLEQEILALVEERASKHTKIN